VSRRTLNDWGTLAYICAVSVPNETNKEQMAAIAARGEQIKTNEQRRVFVDLPWRETAAAAGQAGRHRFQCRSRASASASAPAWSHRDCNERRYSPMTRARQLHIEHVETERLDIDHATNNAPPPRRQSNARQGGSAYWCNASTQELIEIFADKMKR